jgi:biopolymer transport protein ExbB
MLSHLQELIISGGFVMPPLMAACLVLWYGLFYRLQLLHRGDSRPIYTLVNLKDPIMSHTLFFKVFDQLRQVSGDSIGIHVVLSRAHEEFSKFKQITTTIVMIAPLLGLLGTVGGMIETFDSLGDMSLFSQSGGIAGGISQALVSTQMGLAVAIPGLVIGRILNRKQKALFNELEQAGQLFLKELSHA